MKIFSTCLTLMNLVKNILEYQNCWKINPNFWWFSDVFRFLHWSILYICKVMIFPFFFIFNLVFSDRGKDSKLEHRLIYDNTIIFISFFNFLIIILFESKIIAHTLDHFHVYPLIMFPLNDLDLSHCWLNRAKFVIYYSDNQTVCFTSNYRKIYISFIRINSSFCPWIRRDFIFSLTNFLK